MTVFGRLKLGNELGRGALASVHRVVDEASGAIYAAKIPHPRHARDPRARERFLREAEMMADLVDDHVVRVHGVAELDDRPALLMELVEGPTLADVIAREGPLPDARVRHLVRGVARGLDAAHRRGIIHRDLKPANVLVRAADDVPKIADFGLARAASLAGADQAALTLVGTPPYMAPESVDPLAVDARADLYALGCIAFELITGAPPFSGDTPFAVIDRHRNEPPPPLGEHTAADLAHVVARLLAKRPGDRLQAASAVVEALADGITNQETRALALTSGASLGERCVRCGDSLLVDVPVCFGCGLEQVAMEPGDRTVFVVGPGRIAEKLSSRARDQLVRFMRDRPRLGLDPGPLEAQIPRLPFVVAQGISMRSARALSGALAALELVPQVAAGGPRALPEMADKARKLTRRRATVLAAVACAPGVAYPLFALPGLVLVGLALPFVFAVVRARSSRPVTRTGAQLEARYSPRIGARLRAVADTSILLKEARHRQALRAVTERLLGLLEGASTAERENVEPDVLHALAVASEAARRMDELDAHMGRPDFDPSSPSDRRMLHARDTWSARLLRLTARLDALAIRQLRATANDASPNLSHALDDLEAEVAALEEVERM